MCAAQILGPQAQPIYGMLTRSNSGFLGPKHIAMLHATHGRHTTHPVATSPLTSPAHPHYSPSAIALCCPSAPRLPRATSDSLCAAVPSAASMWWCPHVANCHSTHTPTTRDPSRNDHPHCLDQSTVMHLWHTDHCRDPVAPHATWVRPRGHWTMCQL